MISHSAKWNNSIVLQWISLCLLLLFVVCIIIVMIIMTVGVWNMRVYQYGSRRQYKWGLWFFRDGKESKRQRPGEGEGWLIDTLIVFSYVFLTCGCLWNKPVDFLTSITLKHHPDKIRLSTRNIFLLCVFYNWSYLGKPVKFSISGTANLTVENLISS